MYEKVFKYAEDTTAAFVKDCMLKIRIYLLIYLIFLYKYSVLTQAQDINGTNTAAVLKSRFSLDSKAIPSFADGMTWFFYFIFANFFATLAIVNILAKVYVYVSVKYFPGSLERLPFLEANQDYINLLFCGE